MRLHRTIATSISVTFALLPLFAFAQTAFFLPPLKGIEPTSPDKLIHLLYLYSLILAGIAGFLAFVIGGVMYLTAAGNPSKAEEAKDRLIHALLGFLVIVFAGATLRFINPDFFRFEDLVIPGTIRTLVKPIGFLPGGEYLSCEAQAGSTTGICVPYEGSCGDDPQCAPCMGKTDGDACAPAKSGEGAFTYIECVLNVPCKTEQGGECPPNYPCSEITGGQKSDWRVVSASACSDPENPVVCIDGEPFDPARNACCALGGSSAPAGAPPESTLAAECYAQPNPAPANYREGVSFGIKATGTGDYDCRWSGAFEASGCNPEHVFILPGQYTARVEVFDRGTSQKDAASCIAEISGLQLSAKNIRTLREGSAGVEFCPDDPWQAALTDANPLEDVFLKVWRDGAVIQDWAAVGASVPPPLDAYAPPLVEKTSVTGSWAIAGNAFKPQHIAGWQMQAKVRGIDSNMLDFEIKPCLRITNEKTGETQASLEPDPSFAPFCVEDPWTLEAVGPPDVDVWLKRWFDGSVWNDWTNFSPPKTDPLTGKWSLTGNFNRCLIGSWQEQARMRDAAGTDRFSDLLPFSVKSCLAVSCSDASVARPAQFSIAGNVAGDQDRAGWTSPNPSYECYWVGPGAVSQGPPPSPALCAGTGILGSTMLSAGTHLATLRARDAVSDCSAQAIPHPQPAEQSYTDATCTLTVN